jgi:hypothetical protein
MNIATAGSCFAQHIARHARGRGYNVIDTEPAPQGVPDSLAKKYGYSLFSARFGNIYSVRQLLQLLRECLGQWTPSNAIWEHRGRFFDAMRPSVEPLGLASDCEVRAHRGSHLTYVRRMFEMTDVLIFTLGLTESWVDAASGTVYPTAPGTIAGDFDPQRCLFKNFRYDEILADFREFWALLKSIRAGVKAILTVSPVPLTATATKNHVLVATTYSKSVLRAVAGTLADENDDIDYFPSYEIIAGHPSRGFFFDGNLRSVAAAGVEVVMGHFFGQHGPVGRVAAAPAVTPKQAQTAAPTKVTIGHNEAFCDEALLEAFGR